MNFFLVELSNRILVGIWHLFVACLFFFFGQGYTLGIPAGIGLGAGGIWKAFQIQAVPGESYKEAPTRHGQNGLVFVAKMAWSGMTFREYRRLGRAKVARWLRQNGMVAAPA